MWRGNYVARMEKGVSGGRELADPVVTVLAGEVGPRELRKRAERDGECENTPSRQQKFGSVRMKPTPEPTVRKRPPDTTRRRRPTIPPHPDARRLTLRRN